MPGRDFCIFLKPCIRIRIQLQISIFVNINVIVTEVYLTERRNNTCAFRQRRWALLRAA